MTAKFFNHHSRNAAITDAEGRRAVKLADLLAWMNQTGGQLR
jgi:hypothetical protein